MQAYSIGCIGALYNGQSIELRLELTFSHLKIKGMKGVLLHTMLVKSD